VDASTKKSSKVSVVIPCFNDGLYLTDAVQSILSQSFRDFHIIVVDDASSDATTKQVLRSLEGHALVEVVFLEKNAGTAGARNRGITLAKSPYILTLDANDMFAPSFLEKAVAVLEEHPGVGVVTCGVQHFGKQALYWLPKGGTVENFLVENNCCGNALFRRRFWEDAGGYDSSILYEDWEFWISGTAKGWEVHVIQEPLFFYRKQAGTKSTQDALQKAAIYRQIVKKHKEIYCKNIEEVLYQKEVQLTAQYFMPRYQRYLSLLCWMSNVRSLVRGFFKRTAGPRAPQGPA